MNSSIKAAARANGADIIDLKNPADGALGAVAGTGMAGKMAVKMGGGKVEKQVADYDAKKAAEAAELKKAQEAAAEEGWTLVVSGKNHNKVRAADGTVVKAAGGRASAQGRLRKSRKRSKKTKAPVLDFYRMHRNERKKSEIAELRERFDADKARIEAMRARKRYG